MQVIRSGTGELPTVAMIETVFLYYFTEDELSARGKWAIAVHQVLIVITVFVHTNSVRRLA